MLYFDCCGKRYYAGQEDLESRHATLSGAAVSVARIAADD